MRAIDSIHRMLEACQWRRKVILAEYFFRKRSKFEANIFNPCKENVRQVPMQLQMWSIENRNFENKSKPNICQLNTEVDIYVEEQEDI